MKANFSFLQETLLGRSKVWSSQWADRILYSHDYAISAGRAILLFRFPGEIMDARRNMWDSNKLLSMSWAVQYKYPHCMLRTRSFQDARTKIVRWIEIRLGRYLIFLHSVMSGQYIFKSTLFCNAAFWNCYNKTCPTGRDLFSGEQSLVSVAILMIAPFHGSFFYLLNL